jgi:Zn-dependent peptidase ImmA (M78 family)
LACFRTQIFESRFVFLSGYNHDMLCANEGQVYTDGAVARSDTLCYWAIEVNSMKSLGRLLRERREAFGADLNEAAQWCDRTPEWLADKESRDDLSSTDFERICRGLAISPAALLAGEGDSPTRGVARFRSSLQDSDMFEPHDLRLVAAASEVGRILADLLTMQGKGPSFDKYRRIRGLSNSLDPWEEGYRLGEAAREQLVPCSGPIAHLEHSMNDGGIHVARVEFRTNGIEGACAWESGAVPVILLNNRARRVGYSLSRRAILAHELCHLLHDGGEADIATRATCSEKTGNYAQALEQRARAFAPAYLAPPNQVREWVKTVAAAEPPTEAVIKLASHWGLSFEGAIWHAKNCGIIEPEIAEKLAATDFQPILPSDDFDSYDNSLSLLKGYPELPEHPPPLMSGWAAKLVVEALRDSVISAGRAKELLAWR